MDSSDREIQARRKPIVNFVRNVSYVTSYGQLYFFLINGNQVLLVY